jgi:hypothetical protein
VPPHVTAPAGIRAPRLIRVIFTLQRGAMLTVILTVRISRAGRLRTPPHAVEVSGTKRALMIQSGPGPQVCAGAAC